MTIVVSIGGLATDWSVTNQSGDYHAWIDAPFSQPSLTTTMVGRDGTWPVGTGVKQNVYALPPIHVQIMDAANEATLRPALLAALDTSRAFKALVIADDDGSNERYWMCSFQAREERDEARGTGRAFVVSAVVTGDPYPRSVTAKSAAASLTATGQTLTVTNDGDLDSYPAYFITPTAPRTGNSHWKYRVFVAVPWRSPSGAVNHPIRVSEDLTAWDTTGLTPTKAINGTSVGLIVDGVEVDRWFENVDGAVGGFDSTSTIMWANLDFQPGLTVTLSAALTTGALSELTVNEDISAFPPQGILFAQTQQELFYYTGRDLYRRTFTGVTRAAYGSSASAHSTGAKLYWLQHEIFIVYSPATNLARVPDDSRKPVITGGNTFWVWDILGVGFGSKVQPDRSAQWRPVTAGGAWVFTGDQLGTETDPFDVMGIANETPGSGNLARWQVYLPAGFDSFTLEGDDSEGTPAGDVKIMGSPDGANWTELSATGGSGAAWTPWTSTVSGLANTWRYLSFGSTAEYAFSQVTKATVYMHDDYQTYCNRFPEMANYALEMTITNETTGEAISLRLPVGLALNDTVEVDTEAKTVVSTPLNRNVYSALRRDRSRQTMLRLAPGANTLRINEAGLAGVDVALSWAERWYS